MHTSARVRVSDNFCRLSIISMMPNSRPRKFPGPCNHGGKARSKCASRLLRSRLLESSRFPIQGAKAWRHQGQQAAERSSLHSDLQLGRGTADKEDTTRVAAEESCHLGNLRNSTRISTACSKSTLHAIQEISLVEHDPERRADFHGGARDRKSCKEPRGRSEICKTYPRPPCRWLRPQMRACFRSTHQCSSPLRCRQTNNFLSSDSERRTENSYLRCSPETSPDYE